MWGCTPAAPLDHVDATFFRPNLVITGAALRPYEEESWHAVAFGAARFVSAGPCPRCRMINIDQVRYWCAALNPPPPPSFAPHWLRTKAPVAFYYSSIV